MKRDFEDFDPNIRRKIEGSNYDLEKGLELKPKTKIRGARLEAMRKDLRKRTGDYGNQALLEYVLSLGWEKFKEEHIDPQEELDQLAENR